MIKSVKQRKYLYSFCYTFSSFCQLRITKQIHTTLFFQAQQLTSTYTMVNLLQVMADGNQERLGVVAELFMNQLCATSLQMETFISLYSAPNDWFSYKTIMKLLPRFATFFFVDLILQELCTALVFC